MSEPTITCPKCQSEIRLTDSLAAPLLKETAAKYEKQLALQHAEFAKRETKVRDQELALQQAREGIDKQVHERVAIERRKVAEEERRNAKLAIGNELEQKQKELGDLQEVLKLREVKLGEAQKAQAELVKKQRELDDARREMDLTIEKRVSAGSVEIQKKARQEAEDQLMLKVSEKDQVITSMQRQIEELRRKSEQGSQQLQGEVLELEIESILATRFARDAIQPVPKGEHGGDILHRVSGPLGVACGTILWESKRTRNWSDGWLTKLREDQRAAKAEIAIIVSQVLPKGVEHFDLVEGVYVVHPRCVIPIATTLRQALIELSMARQASEGQQTKMEMVYQYLTGARFKLRIQAIAEAFTSMQEDLDKERKVITRQWAKRGEQIERVMQSTVGLYGDLQGIAGQTLLEIEGLSMDALAAPATAQPTPRES